MGKPIGVLSVSGDRKRELERIRNAPTFPRRLARRAWIVLLRAGGRTPVETAAEVGVNRPVVILRERRLADLGLAGLEDAPGRGRKATIPAAAFRRAGRCRAVATSCAGPVAPEVTRTKPVSVIELLAGWSPCRLRTRRQTRA